MYILCEYAPFVLSEAKLLLKLSLPLSGSRKRMTGRQLDCCFDYLCRSVVPYETPFPFRCAGITFGHQNKLKTSNKKAKWMLETEGPGEQTVRHVNIHANILKGSVFLWKRTLMVGEVSDFSQITHRPTQLIITTSPHVHVYAGYLEMCFPAVTFTASITT